MGELTPGTVFAGHRIEGVAGRGGMGVVYRATHLALDITVALKLIQPDLAGDPGFRERFQRESRLAASIEHPNVLQVRHAGEEDGLLYITMRYVEGTDLRALLDQKGRLEPAEAVDLLGQIAGGLDAAHARGLVHRDVKPANVLIEEVAGGRRRAYLTDFGLTRHATSAGGLTKTGHWVGTLDYVAPEQIEGKPVDARADVYALGCVFYEMLTGAVPFMKESEVATMYSHLNEPPPRPSKQAATVSPELDEVVMRAMAKDPADRYPSAGDLAHAADAALEGTSTSRPEMSVAVGHAAPAETAESAGAAEPAPAGETRAAPASPTRAPTAAPAAQAPASPTAGGRTAAPAGKRRRGLLIGAAVAGVAAVAVVVALVAGGGGSSGPSAAEQRDTYIRQTLVPGFQTAFSNEDLAGIKAFLAPDSNYVYPGFADRPPDREYDDLFGTLNVENYQLTLDSLSVPEVSDADAAGGATVATATLSYSYDHKTDVNSGKVEMDFIETDGTDPKISEVRAKPDLYAYFDVPADAAPAKLDVVARIGKFGNPIVDKQVSLDAGKNIPVDLQISDFSVFDENEEVHYAATGRDTGGKLNIDGTIGYPYSD
jgi:Protein kinase domain